MVASFTHVFLLAEKILKSRSFVLNIYRKKRISSFYQITDFKRRAILWLCQYCGHENDETSTVCDNCGAIRDDNIGDSGDNKDSEDLIFDDEGI
jgi:rubrerythrin